jgi:hypothetical protein
MKKTVLASLIVFLSFLFLSLSAQIPIFAQEEDYNVLKTEQIGTLKYGTSSDEVLKILGQPEEKTESTFEAATGTLVSSWIYKKQGLKLDMSVEAKGDSKNAKPKIRAKMKVNGITAEYPCDYKTKKGLGIGATRESVLDAYKDVPLDFGGGKDALVFGSIYGGLFFYFKDDKVVKIFIGEGAE